MYQAKLLIVLTFIALLVDGQVPSQSYSWKNVKTGGGGGFVPGIIFNPSEKVRKVIYSTPSGITTFLGTRVCPHRHWGSLQVEF